MRKFIILTVPLGIVIYLGMMGLFISYQNDIKEVTEKRKMDIAINYATDAAVEELIHYSSNLGMDNTLSNVSTELTASPTVAINAFCDVLLRSCRMADSEENRVYLKTQCIPALCVTDYDGYYIASPDIESQDLVFTIKQPYTYKKASPNGTVLNYYALNFGLSNCVRFQVAQGGGTQRSQAEKVYAPESSAVQLEIINNIVSRSIMQTVRNTSKEKSLFYVPAELSNISRTNPIRGISVLAYVEMKEPVSDIDITTFAVGGTKIIPNRAVTAFIRDGMRLYAYSDTLTNQDKAGIVRVFSTAKEAAEHGYYFDYTKL